MAIDDGYKKLIARIKRAKGTQKKTKIWQDADLSRSDGEQVVREMILSVPKGYYKIHDRAYGTNLVDTIYEIYGWMPSMLVSESMLLGIQALYPEKVYASFTLGLDAVEIKVPKRQDIIDIDDYGVGRIDTTTRKRKVKSPPKHRPRSMRTETQVRGIRK